MITLFLKSLAFFALFNHLFCQENEFTRAKQGQTCNSTVRCDSSLFLTCVNSVCECQKPGAMYYDPIIGSCLTFAREKCRYPVIKTKEVDGKTETTKTTMEDVDCVQNAWCNQSGFCSCENGYVELSNGTCILKRFFDESCTSDVECRQDQFLICLNGRCGCNETLATYNVLIRQCVGKAGKPCIGSSSSCVYNAECIDSSASYLAFTKRRMRQSVQLCGCNPGFIEDRSGFCRVGLGGSCSNSKPCASDLICKDKRCVCRYENVQVGMSRSQSCTSLVGGPCNETLWKGMSANSVPIASNNNSTDVPATFHQQRVSYNCVDNAFCARTGNDSIYECQCKDGFTESGDGTCDLAFGTQCQSDSSANFDTITEFTDFNAWNRNLFCDRKIPLYCVNGLCQCESDLYEFDTLQQKCLGKYGAKCKIGSANNGIETCIKGAKCHQVHAGDNLYGRCICLDGLMATSSRLCTKPV